MMTEFDEMSARELRIADADLAHIAETEQLTDPELDRITAKVLGRIDLTPLEPEITVRHSKKRRFRVVGPSSRSVASAVRNSRSPAPGGAGSFACFHRAADSAQFSLRQERRRRHGGHAGDGARP